MFLRLDLHNPAAVLPSLILLGGNIYLVRS
jgi:hypothetical protein